MIKRKAKYPKVNEIRKQDDVEFAFLGFIFVFAFI